MRGIGLREWVALGVLGVGVVLGFMFFDPTSTDGGTPTPGTISLGEAAPTATPTPVPGAPTPTPVPVKQLKEPGGEWLFLYYTKSRSGGEIRSGEGFAGRLAVDEPGRPFPDFQDDAWRLEATQSVTLDVGRYGFRLETDGEVKVTVGDRVVLEAGDEGSPKTRTVEFDHAGGTTSIAISIRDTGGPVRLRWLE
jgi:hypothetical protein